MNKESGRNLKELELEELWQLFPIHLTPHDPVWKEWADEEIEALESLLRDYHPLINHIGSTSIPGIFSKPIVDLLVELPSKKGWDRIADIMEFSGYILMSRGPEKMSFNKGYTAEGYAERVFHIHFHLSGNNDEILFRDYLIQNPDTAREYEKLKLSLLPRFRNDRDGYTASKSEFVRKVVCLAKRALIREMLSGKMGLDKVRDVAEWAGESLDNRKCLWEFSESPDRRTSVNSLWVLTHLDNTYCDWLEELQPELIRRVLVEEDPSKKRIYLQILREQSFNLENELTIRLLNYCFSKINSECEAYAVRCCSIYIAYKICRDNVELLTELEQYLEMLSLQPLSPGLKSALRQIKSKTSRNWPTYSRLL